MRLLSYFYVSAFALSAAASPMSPEFQKSPHVSEDTPETSTAQVRATGLHPDDFDGIEAMQAFHDLIKGIVPSIYQAANIAGVKMDDVLSGTPLTWDEDAAKALDLSEKRSLIAIEPLLAHAIEPLLANVSKVMFGFISKFAGMANREMLGSIVDTLADYISD